MKTKIKNAVAERIEIDEYDNISIVHWWLKAAKLIKDDLDRACDYIRNESNLEELYFLGPCYFEIVGFTEEDYKKLIEALRDRYDRITEEEFNNTHFKSDQLNDIKYNDFLEQLHYWAWTIRTKNDDTQVIFQFDPNKK